MDKMNVTFSRAICEVLDKVFSHYTNGFFNYILNYTFGEDGRVKRSEDSCECIEEAVSELEDGIERLLSMPDKYPWEVFCMDIDKWDRVIVFLRSLNIHTVSLLISDAVNTQIPDEVAQEYLDIVGVAYRHIMFCRDRHSRNK